MAKITIEIEVKNLKESLKDHNDFQKECGEEETSMKDYCKMPFEEFISKVGGRIDNFSYFSKGNINFKFEDDNGEILHEKSL